jgi:hypothetical protein
MKNLATGKTVNNKLILHEKFLKPGKDGQGIALLAIRRGTPFKEIAKELGPVKTIFLISEIIRNYCRQYNVSKNMTPDQIEDYAAECYLDFTDRSGNSVMIEEIIIVFERAAAGQLCHRTTKKPLVPFDRIDRTILDEILDTYFETDRTKAVWAIEDEKRERIEKTPPELRLANEGGTAEPETIGEIYTKLAGKPGAISLQKLHEKYGSNDAKGISGNDGEQIEAQ